MGEHKCGSKRVLSDPQWNNNKQIKRRIMKKGSVGLRQNLKPHTVLPDHIWCAASVRRINLDVCASRFFEALRSWRVGIWEFRLFPNWSQNSWIARAPSCQVSAASPWMFITVEQMSWFLLFNHLETSWQPECVRRFQVEMASDLFRCSTWRNGVTNKTTGSDLLGTRQFET